MSDHNTMQKWIRSVCLFLCLALVATAGHGRSRPVVKKLKVLGTAVIHKKNQAQARKDAVDNALTIAVGQVVMEMLTSETVTRRFQIINDTILSKKNHYIQNYRVITKSVSGSTIRALVDVDVSVDRISQDLSGLGLAKTDAVYPRIVFMIAERNIQNENFIYWWGDKQLRNRTISESSIAGAFQDDGFKIAGIPDLASPLGLPVNIPEKQMMVLAKQLGADVLIAGSGTAVFASGTHETTKAVEAIVDARALRVKTGELIGQTHKKNVISNQEETTAANKALAGAGAQAGKGLARQVMAAWLHDQASSTVIAVAVEGTGGYIANFVRLRKTITSLSGVRELKMQAMSADRADMSVHYQGSTRSLADALLLKTFDGFSIDIFDVTQDAIRIHLVHK